MDYFSVLPMAFVMVVGPPFISAVLLAAAPNAGRNSLGYLAGAAVSVLAASTVIYWAIRLIKSAAGGGTSQSRSIVDRTIDSALLALLVAVIVVLLVTRTRSRPPRSMDRLGRADPNYSRQLGFLLFVRTPVALIVLVAVGATLVRYDRPWWQLLPFVALTVLLAALPLLVRLWLGVRAAVTLRRIRDWSAANAWLVGEFAAVYFIGVVASNLIG